MFFYWQFFGGLRMSGGYFQFQAPQLRVMPARILDETAQKPFVEDVRRIVEIAKSRAPTANERIQVVRNRLDEQFFELFELNESEREVMRDIDMARCALPFA